MPTNPDRSSGADPVDVESEVIDAADDDYVDIDRAPADPLSAILGGAGGSGGLDLGALMEQASAMQSQIAEAQAAAAETVLEGVAGGGAVKVQVTGTLDFRSVTIDPGAVDPADVEMLQDLVLAAVRHAVDQVNDLQSGAVDLGGMDLGGLLGG